MLEDIIRNVWPLLVLQVAFQVIALLNLRKRNKVRFEKKWIWVLIIVFGSMIGTISYFVFRGEEDGYGSED